VSTAALVANSCIAVVAIIGYVVLSALGHDGNALLAWLGGQGSALAVHAFTTKQAGA
jgi:hypothetical protein